MDLARWLQTEGLDIGIVSVAKSSDEVCSGTEIHGIKNWCVRAPRIISDFNSAKSQWWEKLIWILQEHFDPRNLKAFRKVIDEFNPDIVLIYSLQGIGSNVTQELYQRALPFLYFVGKNGHMLKDHIISDQKPAIIRKWGVSFDRILSTWSKKIFFEKSMRATVISHSTSESMKVTPYLSIENWPHRVIDIQNSGSIADGAKIDMNYYGKHLLRLIDEGLTRSVNFK